MAPDLLRTSARTAVIAAGILPLLAGSACAGPQSGAPAPEAARLSSHVILVSVDGLRPDAITERGTPTLHRLATEGSRSLDAATVIPSRTLPAHISMLTGLAPEDHGITANLDIVPLEGYAPFPTLFSVAGASGLATAAFLGKVKLRYLSDPGAVDHVSLPDTEAGAELGAATTTKAVEFLRSSSPNLIFVHIGDPDYAGHQYGWMSEPYAQAVRGVDVHVRRLLAAADSSFGAGSYTVVVTADHGGDSQDHGSDADPDVTIPWIIWGKGVASGVDVRAPVRTTDTTPTVLRILGLPPIPESTGRPVEEALTPESIRRPAGTSP